MVTLGVTAQFPSPNGSDVEEVTGFSGTALPNPASSSQVTFGCVGGEISVAYRMVPAAWIVGTVVPTTAPTTITLEDATASPPVAPTVMVVEGAFNVTVVGGQTYEVNLLALAYNLSTQYVPTNPNETSWLNVTMGKEVGWIAGSVRPKDARLSIQDPVGGAPAYPLVSPTGQFNVSRVWGAYWVNATLAGYRNCSELIEVFPGQTNAPGLIGPCTLWGSRIEGTLDPASATLTIDGAPENVEYGFFNVSLPGNATYTVPGRAVRLLGVRRTDRLADGSQPDARHHPDEPRVDHGHRRPGLRHAPAGRRRSERHRRWRVQPERAGLDADAGLQELHREPGIGRVLHDHADSPGHAGEYHARRAPSDARARLPTADVRANLRRDLHRGRAPERDQLVGDVRRGYGSGNRRDRIWGVPERYLRLRRRLDLGVHGEPAERLGHGPGRCRPAPDLVPTRGPRIPRPRGLCDSRGDRHGRPDRGGALGDPDPHGADGAADRPRAPLRAGSDHPPPARSSGLAQTHRDPARAGPPQGTGFERKRGRNRVSPGEVYIGNPRNADR